MALEVDVNHLLMECEVPTLIVGAKDDLLIRKSRLEVMASLRQTEVKLIDGPHLLIQSRPEQFRELLEGFIDTLMVRCEEARNHT